MLLIGLLTALGLALLGVPYALLLGILAGLLELIPYLGPWISGAVAVVVTLLTVDPFKALQVVVLFIIIQEVEGNLVQPFVMSWAVHVDPLLVLIAITVGAAGAGADRRGDRRAGGGHGAGDHAAGHRASDPSCDGRE